MRRVAAQPLALVERLVDEADVALLEVAQAAVDELGALRRRAAGEVVGLDEGRAQAPGGGVEGDAGAGDAAADDEHVERLGGQALEHRRPGRTGATDGSSAGIDAECTERRRSVTESARDRDDCLWRAPFAAFYRSVRQLTWMGDSYVSFRDIEWRKLGACRGLDASIFYPDDDDDAVESPRRCARAAGCEPRASSTP